MKKAEKWQAEVNRFAHEINQIMAEAIQHIDQIQRNRDGPDSR